MFHHPKMIYSHDNQFRPINRHTSTTYHERPFMHQYLAVNHVVNLNDFFEELCINSCSCSLYNISSNTYKWLPKGRQKSFETILEPFESHSVIIATALHYNPVLHIFHPFSVIVFNMKCLQGDEGATFNRPFIILNWVNQNPSIYLHKKEVN